MNRLKPILITGAHRSGTTWVGKMLSLSNKIAYIHEPFNKVYRNTGFGIQPAFWFQYIDESNQSEYYQKLLDTLHLKTISPGKANIRNINDLKIFLKKNGQFLVDRINRRRPLLKDPIALFSTPWLVENFNFVPVILIRHPAAFVNSIKKQNWAFDFGELYKQKTLMRTLLADYSEEIKDFSKKDFSILDQAILLWKITHEVIYEFQQNYLNWIFVKHENVAADPLDQFKTLYTQLGIPFTNKTEAAITQYTQKNSGHQESNVVNQIRRNSQKILESWKEELKPSEIDYILKKTEYPGKSFYPVDF